MRRAKINYGRAADQLPPMDLIRLLSLVNVDPVTGCWLWQASADDKGYGNFKAGGKRHWAHRVSFASFRGELRDGMDVHHLKKCKHGARCVNPLHLAQRDRSWNSADGGRRRHQPKRSLE